MDCLVDHQQRQPILDLANWHLSSLDSPQQIVDLIIDLLAALLFGRWVGVEAAAVLTSLEACFDQFRHRAAAFEPAIGKGFAQIPRHVRPDIDAHLVNQGQRSHRVAEILHSAVHILDARTFLDQQDRFVEVGGEDTGCVETRPVFDDDAGLALLDAECPGGGHGPRRSLLRNHDLEKRHLGNGREVVHPDHSLGEMGVGGDLLDGKRRGIGREDSIGRNLIFDFCQDPSFEFEVLEDRFDHQVRPLEILDIGGQKQTRPAPVRLDGSDGSRSHLPFEAVVHRLGRSAESFERRIANDYRTEAERHGCHPRPHESTPEDRQTVDLPGLFPIHRFLDLVHGVEETDKAATLWSHRENSKIIALTVQPRQAPPFQTGLDTIEDRQRCRVEASGLP